MNNYVSNLVDYLLDRLEKEKIIYCYGCYFEDNLNIVKDNNKPQKVSIVKKKTYINVYFFEDNVSYKYYYHYYKTHGIYETGPYISNEYEDCVNNYNEYIFTRIKRFNELSFFYSLNIIDDSDGETESNRLKNKCIEYEKYFIDTNYLMEKITRGD